MAYTNMFQKNSIDWDKARRERVKAKFPGHRDPRTFRNDFSSHSPLSVNPISTLIGQFDAIVNRNYGGQGPVVSLRNPKVLSAERQASD